MSYTIVRNRKLTESRVIGANSHNGRKTKNHTNKNIDSTKTHLNYYLKEHEISYLTGELVRFDIFVVARLCDYFDCEITDIIEYVPNKK